MFVVAFFILAPVAAMLMSAIIKHVNSTTEIPGLIPTTIVGSTGAARRIRGGSGFIEAFLLAIWRCIACRLIFRKERSGR